MKTVLKIILRILARLIVNKYQPIIIGITGSIGKTSTKDAIYAVISGNYETRRSIQNYNNEIGVPLTIIGVESPASSFFGWFKVLLTALKQIFILNKDYPEVLVLEMAADKPGDISYLVKVAPCKIGIITTIAPVHLENFKTIKNVRKEKMNIITHLKSDGWAVINGDNEEISDHLSDLVAQLFTFGFNLDNKLWASDIKFSQEIKNELPYVSGLKAKLHYADAVVPFYLPGILAYHYVYSALAAIAVGTLLDINLVILTERLRQFHPPKGRLSLLEGIKQTWIIDDTYNSSPAAVEAALEVFKSFPQISTGKKIAVLGDMNELGEYTKTGHEEVGKAVAAASVDILITYGKNSKLIANSAQVNGLGTDKVFELDTHEAIVTLLKKIINRGDVILVKGSQTGIRLEKVVKRIMAHPESASELLVRQGEEWD